MLRRLTFVGKQNVRQQMGHSAMKKHHATHMIYKNVPLDTLLKVWFVQRKLQH